LIQAAVFIIEATICVAQPVNPRKIVGAAYAGTENDLEAALYVALLTSGNLGPPQVGLIVRVADASRRTAIVAIRTERSLRKTGPVD
jgi:hypothetical protein